jgi:thiol:disulfide interchange protein DsbD
MNLKLAVFAAVGFLALGVARAQESVGAFAEGGPKVRASLVAEHEALAPGRVNYIGIRLEIEPGWHVYYDGLNDTGLPLSADFRAPDGVKIGALIWPAPKRKVLGDFIIDHIYEKQVLLLAPVRVEHALAGSRVEIAASLEWMVCQEACLLETSNVTLSAEVADEGSEPRRSKASALFEETRKRLPVEEGWKSGAKKPDAEGAGPASETNAASISITEGSLVVEAAGADEIVFYPGSRCSRPVDLIEDGAARGSRLEVRFEGGPEHVEGLVEVKRGKESQILRVRHPGEPEREIEAGG